MVVIRPNRETDLVSRDDLVPAWHWLSKARTYAVAVPIRSLRDDRLPLNKNSRGCLQYQIPICSQVDVVRAFEGHSDTIRIGIRRDYKIIFKIMVVAAIVDVDSGIDRVVLNLAECRYPAQ